MASSKVMTSSSPPNPDAPSQAAAPPLHSGANLHSDYTRGFGSMNMEDIFDTIYSDSDSFVPERNAGEVIGNGGGNKTADEVWRDIVSGSVGSGQVGMTLEAFLAKAGAVNEEDIGVSEVVNLAQPATGVPAAQFSSVVCMQNAVATGVIGVEFGNRTVTASVNGGGGRGKRRAAVEEAPVDKATQQKQRRMIKNRESAARSRERKQAYTAELESNVTQLEEENARLMEAEARLNKERYKQLMENLIPVVEKRRPPRVLRRVRSMNW